MEHPDKFVNRHIGPSGSEIKQMQEVLGVSDLPELIDQVIPSPLKRSVEMNLPIAMSEHEALDKLRRLAKKNLPKRSLLGLGYYDCHIPPVIQRNVFENPGWYTQYTPYQAEIAQGRLEALLNFQTLITELTRMDIANASLLDEATAAAEAISMLFAKRRDKTKKTVWVDSTSILPQTLSVIKTRAIPLGITIAEGNLDRLPSGKDEFAAIISSPSADGKVHDIGTILPSLKKNAIKTIVCSDLLALCLIKAPGESGADVVVGSTQRFGQPLGFGGPHAAFFATKDEYKRNLPGRLVGVSVDKEGRTAYRLALQTREQHIRREKATSNICTAQVLLAIMASMYAIYHGPTGLRKIAERVHTIASLCADCLKKSGFHLKSDQFFDTIEVILNGGKDTISADEIIAKASDQEINLRKPVDGSDAIVIAFDEKSDSRELTKILGLFSVKMSSSEFTSMGCEKGLSPSLRRQDKFLAQDVFNSHTSETQMLRYIKKLESRDLSLAFSMIPLGSCTMKLNATSEMFPVSWPEWAGLHPFIPDAQWEGYQTLFENLDNWLCEITGFSGVSLQPNAGSQGEFAGLLAIREYHLSRGNTDRNICLIPTSAHGTNPASAVMAGMSVVSIKCDDNGNIDIDDLSHKAEKHKDQLSALMITYPSTHGVFEESIKDICEIVHRFGGQVYMDGANLNALVGLCSPKEFGTDVCHINLHKTFCIPHGGGGPGMGPIAVAEHLVPFLPGHPHKDHESQTGPVSAAPFSSASILVIPWMYIQMMGGSGLTSATEVAILSANYIAHRLEEYYPILYKGKNGRVAHECILDLRQFNKVTVEDVAKRLMDYGFHAPTVSWPVANTLMVEPTESESLMELDRFCQAMISIREEIDKVEAGRIQPDQSPLKNAPHTASQLIANEWGREYSKQVAVYPCDWTKDHKFWPAVSRIDNVYGDRNPVCTCPSVEEFADS